MTASPAEEWAVCPDVLTLPDGGYRMYFQARSASGHNVILSAVSEDGLHWTREAGIRFADQTPRSAPVGNPKPLGLSSVGEFDGPRPDSLGR